MSKEISVDKQVNVVKEFLSGLEKINNLIVHPIYEIILDVLDEDSNALLKTECGAFPLDIYVSIPFNRAISNKEKDLLKKKIKDFSFYIIKDNKKHLYVDDFGEKYEIISEGKCRFIEDGFSIIELSKTELRIIHRFEELDISFLS